MKYKLYDASHRLFLVDGGKTFTSDEVEDFINEFDKRPQVIEYEEAITVIPFFMTNGQNKCWFESNVRLIFINAEYEIEDFDDIIRKKIRAYL